MPTQSTNTSVGIQATANEKWVVNAGVTVSSNLDDAFSAPQFNVNNVGLVNHGTLLSTYEGGHGVYIRGENSAAATTFANINDTWTIDHGVRGLPTCALASRRE